MSNMTEVALIDGNAEERFAGMEVATGWSAWLSGRTSVSGQRSFAVLRSTRI